MIRRETGKQEDKEDTYLSTCLPVSLFTCLPVYPLLDTSTIVNLKSQIENCNA